MKNLSILNMKRISILLVIACCTFLTGCGQETLSVPPPTTNGDPKAKEQEEYVKRMNESINRLRDGQPDQPLGSPKN